MLSTGSRPPRQPASAGGMSLTEIRHIFYQVTAIGLVAIVTISLMKLLTSVTGWPFCFINNIRATESQSLLQIFRKYLFSVVRISILTCGVHHFKIDVNPAVIPSLIKLLWQLDPFFTISHLFLIFQTCHYIHLVLGKSGYYLEELLLTVIEVFVILIDEN